MTDIGAIRARWVVVTSFQPGLTDRTHLHGVFTTMIRRRRGAAGEATPAQPGAAHPRRAVAAAHRHDSREGVVSS